jgi:hypothetical protein
MPHGKICYLEIPANRAEDSARFYSEIFGWKVRERGDGNLAFDDPGGVSGTWVKEEDRTPDERTRTYIMVDSITESLKRIERAGGKVVRSAQTSGTTWGRSRPSPIRSETSSDSTKSRNGSFVRSRLAEFATHTRVQRTPSWPSPP